MPVQLFMLDVLDCCHLPIRSSKKGSQENLWAEEQHGLYQMAWQTWCQHFIYKLFTPWSTSNKGKAKKERRNYPSREAGLCRALQQTHGRHGLFGSTLFLLQHKPVLVHFWCHLQFAYFVQGNCTNVWKSNYGRFPVSTWKATDCW